MKRVTKPLIVGILLASSAGIGVRAYYASRDSDAAKSGDGAASRAAPCATWWPRPARCRP